MDLIGTTQIKKGFKGFWIRFYCGFITFDSLFQFILTHQHITEAGGQAIAVATDVTKFGEVQKLVDTAKEAYGRVDVIVNNAGFMPLSPGAVRTDLTEVSG